MNVREIVEQYLKDNGYDGLYAEDSCACKVGDLAPCGDFQEQCRAGYLQECDCGEHDWHIGEEKP